MMLCNFQLLYIEKIIVMMVFVISCEYIISSILNPGYYLPTRNVKFEYFSRQRKCWLPTLGETVSCT